MTDTGPARRTAARAGSVPVTREGSFSKGIGTAIAAVSTTIIAGIATGATAILGATGVSASSNSMFKKILTNVVCFISIHRTFLLLKV